MGDDEEDDNKQEYLDKLSIKDKENLLEKRKKNIKNFLFFFIPILLVLIGIGIAFYFILKKKGGKITCKYITTKDNENILLINIKDDIDFSLIIDDIDHERNNYHTFEKPGEHIVTFHFQDKLESIEGFFRELNNLIEADFSEFKADKVKSMENLFYSSLLLNKVTFDNETPNLENLNNIFYRCLSLTEVNLNIDTSNVKQTCYIF